MFKDNVYNYGLSGTSPEVWVSDYTTAQMDVFALRRKTNHWTLLTPAVSGVLLPLVDSLPQLVIRVIVAKPTYGCCSIKQEMEDKCLNNVPKLWEGIHDHQPKITAWCYLNPGPRFRKVCLKQFNWPLRHTRVCCGLIFLIISNNPFKVCLFLFFIYFLIFFLAAGFMENSRPHKSHNLNTWVQKKLLEDVAKTLQPTSYNPPCSQNRTHVT